MAASAAAENFKDRIIEALDIMRMKEVADKQPFKARAYKKVIDGLAALPAIRTYDDVAGIAGIGEKIEEKIREILATGSLASAERAAASHAAHAELLAIYGVGPAKAAELVAAGISSVADLRAASAASPSILNEKQKIGLKYYDDIIQRIPYSEMLEHQSTLADLLPEGVEPDGFEIVGSFRREATTSGDIDVLIRVEEGKSAADMLTEYITIMKGFGYLIETLAHGDKKFMGICQLPGKPARRLDILMTPAAEYPYAVLYFTGSQGFNISVRQWALDKGYTLNEHGMKPIASGALPPTMETEKDIFKFLGIAYVPPRAREAGAVKPIRRLKVMRDEM
jgi:DNA polymerase/3'-5' exonuclease PolX